LQYEGRRFSGEEERKGREGEERRERSSPTSTLERERKRENEIFCPKIK
jgi:hypothetical protein